ncbi:MAG: hypothetical protein H7251_10655 [Acetobacteraceae bacterium]|nr:hypothetical protein [Acetobacteraceae bacterium]
MGQFTLVRHGGYAVAGDPALESAVEAIEITDSQVYTVRRAGGRVFTTLAEAVAAEALAGAGGYFSSLRIAGAEIHVPPEKA